MAAGVANRPVFEPIGNGQWARLDWAHRTELGSSGRIGLVGWRTGAVLALRLWSPAPRLSLDSCFCLFHVSIMAIDPMSESGSAPVFAISQVCSLHSPLETDLENFAAANCQYMEAWFTKLESYLESHSEQQLKELLVKHGITIPVASFQGGLLASQGEARQVSWDQFRARLDLCRQLGIQTVVVAADVMDPLDEKTVQRVRFSARELASEAKGRGLRVALEFQARATFINNLQTCLAIVEEVASPHLGVCLDAFHFHVGCSKHQDLRQLSRETLFHVHLCDVANAPREFAAAADRILPGDGDMDVSLLYQSCLEIGYQGCISLELLNPTIWQVLSRQVAEVGMNALNRLNGR